jgi:hypothetical protein
MNQLVFAYSTVNGYAISAVREENGYPHMRLEFFGTWAEVSIVRAKRSY